MNSKMFLGIVGAVMLSGCATCPPCDPVIGNWSAKLPVDLMPASSLIFSRDDDGNAKAFVLYRWGSPEFCTDVKIDGRFFSLRHPYGQAFEGEVLGDRMFARIAPFDRKTGKITGAWKPLEGWRNPPMPDGIDTDNASFGEAVDSDADYRNMILRPAL